MVSCEQCTNIFLRLKDSLIEKIRTYNYIAIEKIIYIIFFALYTIIVFLFSDFFGQTKLFQILSENAIFFNTIFPCSTPSCLSHTLLNIFMEAYFYYHFSLFLIALCIKKDDYKSSLITIQRGHWGLKLIYISVLILLTMILPRWIHITMYYVSLIGSFIFILYSLISFLNFAAVINVKLIDKVDVERRCDPYVMTLLLISICGFSIAIGITLTIFICFSHSATEKGDCSFKIWNIIFTLLNIVLSVIGVVVSLLPSVRLRKPTSGIFQSSIVAAYTSYLLLDSILSLPCEQIDGCWEVTDCNEQYSLMGNYELSAFGGILFTIIVIAYQTFRNSSEIAEMSFIDDKLPDWTDDLTGEKHYNYSYWKYHLGFCFAVLFTMQNMSDWSYVPYDGNDVIVSTSAYFIKIIDCFICHVLYIWTLVAPIIFPERNFSEV